MVGKWYCTRTTDQDRFGGRVSGILLDCGKNLLCRSGETLGHLRMPSLGVSFKSKDALVLRIEIERVQNRRPILKQGMRALAPSMFPVRFTAIGQSTVLTVPQIKETD